VGLKKGEISMNKSMNKSKQEIKTNYTPRRIMAGAILGLVSVGVFKGVEAASDYVGTVTKQLEYVSNPNTIPEESRFDLSVEQGDNPDTIARKIVNPDADVLDLRLEIYNQAEKGVLYPGQKIVVEKRFVNPEIIRQAEEQLGSGQ